MWELFRFFIHAIVQIGHILKNKQKNMCVCIHHNENEDENEKRSHIYDINRPVSRHGHKYSKY